MQSAARGSWVPGADGSGFGIENLPYGIVASRGRAPRPAVRIGEHALDLARLAAAGLLDVPALDPQALRAPVLNRLLEHSPVVWAALRRRLIELLDIDGPAALAARAVLEEALLPLAGAELALPVAVGDYVDFFSSIEHATNAGRIFRPGAEPLHPNWRRMPVGYQGRAGTIVVGGTPIRRPQGHRAPAAPGDEPVFGPERKLDFELELGFLTGGDGDIFGFAIVNDWSAREIQRWESTPLGPFLGKSFATSLAPWIVPRGALEPVRVPGVGQIPPPAAHLLVAEPRALDLDLEVELVPAGSGRGQVICAVNARGLYWSPEQQLAQATSAGAPARPGDLFASGTISGTGSGSHGCLLERTRDGKDPFAIGDAQYTYLKDGDTVIMRARGGGRDDGRPLICFGELSGTVLAAL